MLQYLLNASAIWLISLILFDAILRRESFHNYNRFYLLLTFLVGALFPLIRLPQAGQYPATLQKPIGEVITVKQNVITASTLAPAHFNWQHWLLLAYVAGVTIAAMLLVIESVKLIAFCRSGTRTKQNGWTIVETGKDHAPFSFLNTLFVCSRQQYDTEEWTMILIHERRHTTLFHFADLLLMQLGRIAFWFHPLVHIYNRRLMLIHEYQADKASAMHPQIYGQFLVEQSLLQASPSVTHSFNRSPIKKRILMLTHRSSKASRTKMLIFIPLALVCVICFSQNTFSQLPEIKGNKFIWRGNVFELSKPFTDTVTLIDPVSGNENSKYIRHDGEAITMNGKPIEGYIDSRPEFTGSDKTLRNYIFRNLRTELGKLEDGIYTIGLDNIIIDEYGRIVYFNYKGMQRSNPDYVPSGHISAPIIENGSDPKVTIVTGQDVDYKGVNDSVPVTRKDIQSTSKTGSGEDIQIASKTDKHTVLKFKTDGKQANTSSGPYTVTVHRNMDPNAHIPVPKANQEEIYGRICKLLEAAPGYKPATMDGKNVRAKWNDDFSFWNSFKIHDHKIFETAPGGKWEELK